MEFLAKALLLLFDTHREVDCHSKFNRLSRRKSLLFFLLLFLFKSNSFTVSAAAATTKLFVSSSSSSSSSSNNNKLLYSIISSSTQATSSALKRANSTTSLNDDSKNEADKLLEFAINELATLKQSPFYRTYATSNDSGNYYIVGVLFMVSIIGLLLYVKF